MLSYSAPAPKRPNRAAPARGTEATDPLTDAPSGRVPDRGRVGALGRCHRDLAGHLDTVRPWGVLEYSRRPVALSQSSIDGGVSSGLICRKSCRGFVYNEFERCQTSSRSCHPEAIGTAK